MALHCFLQIHRNGSSRLGPLSPARWPTCATKKNVFTKKKTRFTWVILFQIQLFGGGGFYPILVARQWQRDSPQRDTSSGSTFTTSIMAQPSARHSTPAPNPRRHARGRQTQAEAGRSTPPPLHPAEKGLRKRPGAARTSPPRFAL